MGLPRRRTGPYPITAPRARFRAEETGRPGERADTPCPGGAHCQQPSASGCLPSYKSTPLITPIQDHYSATIRAKNHRRRASVRSQTLRRPSRRPLSEILPGSGVIPTIGIRHAQRSIFFLFFVSSAYGIPGINSTLQPWPSADHQHTAESHAACNQRSARDGRSLRIDD